MLLEEVSSCGVPSEFSAQQMVPDIQSAVLGIKTAGRLQKAPEKKTGIQVPGHGGIVGVVGAGVVVVGSLLKQQYPPFGQYLSLAISSQSS
jgi:hypothetical protein